jgi:dihydrofolate reductase
MKPTTMTQVTVDGVIQGNGGASDEDRKSGFERGGWAMGVFDEETFTFITQTYQSANAFLFGRKTYDVFAPYCGGMDPGSHPIADALNAKPKYLASNTVTDPQMGGHDHPLGDLAAAIGELKAAPGGELRCTDSGALIRWLLENHLVDEITLLVVPVILGQGTRLFPRESPATSRPPTRPLSGHWRGGSHDPPPHLLRLGNPLQRHPARLHRDRHDTSKWPVGFVNSSAARWPVGAIRFAASVVIEGGLLALVVRVSRRAEPVRARVVAGAAASLEGVGDPRPATRVGRPAPTGGTADAEVG